MAVARTTLLLALVSFVGCTALQVYPCWEDLSRLAGPMIILSGPCTLNCCGRSPGHLPLASFTSKGRPVLAQVEETFSTPRCNFNSTSGVFICSSWAKERCKAHNYTCTVRQGSSTASANISVHQPPGEMGIPACAVANITNISVSMNGSREFRVSWTYTKDLPSQSYCTGARHFQVAFKRYSSYEDGRDDRISSRGLTFRDVPRRETEIVFSNMGTRWFYRFLVRDRRGDSPTASEATPVQYLAHVEPLKWDLNLNPLYIAREGDPRTVSCRAMGVPSPRVTYRKQGSNHERNELFFAAVHLGDNGTYSCRACHEVFDNSRGVFKTNCLTRNFQVFVIAKQKDRDCISYTGTQCSEVLHADWKVFLSNTSINLEDHLSQAIQLSGQFSEKCRVFVKSALCHTLLPYCDPFTVDEGRYSPLPMCPQSCVQLEERCGREIREFGADFAKFLAARCDKDVDVGGPGDKPGCIFIDPDYPLKDGAGADVVPLNYAGLECTFGNGRSYRGHIKTTVGGRECQRWGVQYPNRHQMLKMVGGELEGAWRYCRNPGGLGERPWCFVNSVSKRWDYCDIPSCEQCIPYTGELCEPIGYTSNTSVYFRRQRRDSVETLELDLKVILHLVQDEPSHGCELVAKQLLCAGALPTCRDNVEQDLCENHCHLLELLHICPASFRQSLLSHPYFDFSVCTNITTLTPSPNCLPDPLPVFRDGVREGCHNRSEQANVTTTGKGSHCVPWTLPPSARGLTEVFPELRGSSECHNPGRLRRQPWCFTSSDGAWDFCNVSDSCAGTRTLQTIAPPSSSSRNSAHHTSIVASIATVSGVLLVVIVTAATIIALYQLKSYRGNKEEYVPPDVTNSLYISNPAIPPSLVNITESFKKIQRSKIRYVKQIGQGNFGMVFQGECDWITPNNKKDSGETLRVAVKTHKCECSQQAIEEFIHEANILHKFSHPNIVEFYGVCMDDLPYCMVFEYMDQGDLCQFLRSHDIHDNQFVRRRRSSSTGSNDSVNLGTSVLLDICRQIASGMAYLESEKYIHRDLAARNCLVSTGLVVKIADFGMSRNLYSKDYYRISGEASLPVRWMPPESIIYGTFSSKGDVWTFGVVVWEVFSLGRQPYWSQANDTVIDMIRKGVLLEKPDGCPDKVYTLIKGGCWEMYDNDRMSFGAMEQALMDMRLSDSNSSYTSSCSDASLEDNVFSEVQDVADDDDGDC